MKLNPMNAKQLTLTIFASLFLSLNLNAQSLTATPSDKTFEDVKLTDSVLLDDNGSKTSLKNVSHGLRKVKKFGLVTVSVYVMELFAKNPAQLVKTNDGILGSLKSAGPVQLRLTLARDLKGSQISDSFKEALKANDIDTANTTAELTSVLAAVNEITKFKKGEVFSLTAEWKDATATLFIQRPDQSIQKITGPEKFITDLFSIWFGKPVDDKMEDLKKTLLK
jgi:hypothetical protein